MGVRLGASEIDGDQKPILMAREAWVHRRLRRATDMPIVAAGQLPGIHLWGVAVEPGPRQVGAYVALAWNQGGGSVVAAGTRGHDSRHRFFTWCTGPNIAAIELDTLDAATGTRAPTIPAVLLHHDHQHQVRVFLAAITNSTIVLRAARYLDRHGHTVELEDLAENQRRFEAESQTPQTTN